ncbi:protein FAR1-RELATED SEQUENCE 5-like [Carya illinoinensis]|uniref:protein FAR1-RELATED SEQUENCE 5-like n=1 Tax=Carya illinoinensis TaxID=32201 RepID=UPI001C71F54B|nr:protein FAR1-RELATED SEQUENCE 5-like [Carya illinoinensis]
MASNVHLTDDEYDEVFVDDGPDNYDGTEEPKEDDGVEEPIVGRTFSSEEEVRSYYMRYAKQKGFGVRRRNSRQSEDGRVRWFTLVCVRQGTAKSQASNILKPRQTERVGCKARIYVVLNEDGGYTLSSVILDHTHYVSPGKARHFRCFKKVDARVAKRLEINDEAGIRTSKTFQSVIVEAGGYENVPFGQKECQNYIEKARQLRLRVGGVEALTNYFQEMQKINAEFFYAIDVGPDMRLKNVFWADARSRAAYQSFGDVITFDTTYLTNAYKMPFASFVGVNHHGQSILFGCGLISNEDANTFEWLFESWLKCMNDQPPNAIITDQDKAMKVAIARVFPTTRHRFCLWHIMKKLPEKFGSHSRYDEIKDSLHKCVYDSLSENEFEERWGSLLETNDLRENAWLGLLYADRHYWVPAYVKNTFWAGMSTTQRSEGMNAFFDDYVHSRTTLKQFVDQYDSALRRKAENEAIADFNSFNTEIPCISHYPIEKQFQKIYTIAKFKEVQEEFRGFLYLTTSYFGGDGANFTYVVGDEIKVSDGFIKRVNYFVSVCEESSLDITCSCKLFEFRGILCRHALRILTQLDKSEVPPKYILDRWRKDIKRQYVNVRSSYEATSNPEKQRFNRIQNCFYQLCSNAAKIERSCVKLISQLEQLKSEYPDDDSYGACSTAGLVTPIDGTTSKVLSPLVVRSKGRPTTKRRTHPVEKALKKPSTRRRLSTTEQSSLHDQESQVWTHGPDFFCTLLSARPPPVQAQPVQMNDSDQDDLRQPRWWQP